MSWAQCVLAGRRWLDAAADWAWRNPEASVTEVMAAVPNPGQVLTRPLAGAACEEAAPARRAAWLRDA